MMVEDGPHFEDLHVGWSYTSGGHTITPGHAAWFLAMAGDHNPLHLDANANVMRATAGSPVNTALTAHIAIAQSTRATREVVANLFYRDLLFMRPVTVGTTISTVTSVTWRKQATPRLDRPPRGKVLLRMVTVDETGAPLLQMERLALVRARQHNPESANEAPDPETFEPVDAATAASAWLDLLQPSPVDALAGWRKGEARTDHLSEPVTDPLGLVRLTGNEARAHRAASHGQQSRRLVYGGHTLSLAQAALSRLLACPYAVVAWRRCQHPSPVFEEDELLTSASLQSTRAVAGGRLIVLEVNTRVVSRSADGPVQIWLVEILIPC